MASKKSDDDYSETIRAVLEAYHPYRHQRYAAVKVLLISWEDDDTESATEIKQLQTLFRKSFNYTVEPYLIPSDRSHQQLNLKIAQMINDFGKPYNLLVVYYGDHGGDKFGGHDGPSDKSCTWAATETRSGPRLDWATIQPTLLHAGGDVAIILDCCFAGQAAKAASADAVELLAATDRDKWTFSYTGNHRTFTMALIEEMEKMLKRDKMVTLVGLARNLSTIEANIESQPCHVSLGGDHTFGPIKLAPLCDPRDLLAKIPVASYHLILWLREPLNTEELPPFIRWLTQDSPKILENIQYVEQELVEVNKASQLCNQLLDARSDAEGQLLPYLSEQIRAQRLALCSNVRNAMSSLKSTDLTDSEAMQVVETVNWGLQELLIFIEGLLSNRNTSSLQARDADEFRKAANLDLIARIGTQFSLLSTDARDHDIVIDFDTTQPPAADERLREGLENGKRVLVEYFYIDGILERQNLLRVMRISAFLTEAKSRAFHSMQGVSFIRDSVSQNPYGFVYQMPEQAGNHSFKSLSVLISHVKTVPLEVQMRTAYALCEALLNLHSIGWHHKAINSENILIFCQGCDVGSGCSSSAWALHEPYLIGFFQAYARYTVNTYAARRSIYRHPDTWEDPTPFQPSHDIYPLGILLIEVGCWKLLKELHGKGEEYEFSHAEDLRDLLLGSILDKTTHAAGKQFASAARFCLESQPWSDQEVWQVQKLMSQKVLDPIRACCS